MAEEQISLIKAVSAETERERACERKQETERETESKRERKRYREGAKREKVNE